MTFVWIALFIGLIVVAVVLGAFIGGMAVFAAPDIRNVKRRQIVATGFLFAFLLLVLALFIAVNDFYHQQRVVPVTVEMPATDSDIQIVSDERASTSVEYSTDELVKAMQRRDPFQRIR